MANSRFKPQLESLEARTLMAGNVWAEVDNYGDLELDGDNYGNSVSVFQISNGDWVVMGNVHEGSLTKINNQSTFINGREYSFEVFDNVTRDINIDLDGGNDRLEMYGTYTRAAAPRDVDIEMDGGSDYVNLHDLSVTDDLDIDTESGNDTVALTNVFVGDDLSIDTGKDYDWLFLSNVEVEGEANVEDYEYLRGTLTTNRF